MFAVGSGNINIEMFDGYEWKYRMFSDVYYPVFKTNLFFVKAATRNESDQKQERIEGGGPMAYI